MALPSLHRVLPNAGDPTEHDLRTVRLEGREVTVRLRLRQVEDDVWVGALVFRVAEPPEERRTAEILRGTGEQQVRDSVRSLGTHHLRDLFRSLT
jgi:hypothetical protein